MKKKWSNNHQTLYLKHTKECKVEFVHSLLFKSIYLSDLLLLATLPALWLDFVAEKVEP